MRNETITSIIFILICSIFFGAFLGIVVAKAGVIACGAFLIACAVVIMLADAACKRDAKKYR